MLAPLFDRVGAEADAGGDGCACEVTVESDRLRLVGSDCPGVADLARSPGCRAAAVSATVDETVTAIRTETVGLARHYREPTVDLIVAAGAFADAVAAHDRRIARLAQRNPVRAATEAAGRADAVGAIADRTGLLAARQAVSAASPYSAYRGPTISRWLVDPGVPQDATLRAVRDLSTGGTVREYERAGGDADRYVLEPLEARLTRADLATLARAYRRLATVDPAGTELTVGQAVRAVAGTDAPVDELTRVLEKHTSGYGLLAALFDDDHVSDVFLTAPVESTVVRVRVDGALVRTNVRATDRCVAGLAAHFRRTSGRSFSSAAPTLQATTRVAGRRIRVAGVRQPASPGPAFAFRAHDRRVWTLPALVANGTLSARAAALVSLAATRGRAVLVAGPRGAGKTTFLAATLWELPPTVRTVVIEDAPELPIAQLQSAGRDVQGIVAATDETDLAPAAALRTALRLGDGALVVGEVRGPEASVLYEAMRVGATSEAVLGTIHGSDATAVRERVVDDLDVTPAAFGATDLVVSLTIAEAAGANARQVTTIEEVVDGSGEFATLFARDGDGLTATGRLDRGNSRLLADLAAPGESYRDVLDRLADSRASLEGRVAGGRAPSPVPAGGRHS